MKRLGLILVSGLAVSSTAGQAASEVFTPGWTDVVLAGQLKISAPGNGGYGKCNVVWRGKVRLSGAEAEFKSLKFSGAKPVCQIDTGAAVITFTPSAPQLIQSQSVSWTLVGPKQGQCQGVLSGSVGSTGLWSISSVLGACAVSGYLQSTPAVTIVAK